MYYPRDNRRRPCYIRRIKTAATDNATVRDCDAAEGLSVGSPVVFILTRCTSTAAQRRRRIDYDQGQNAERRRNLGQEALFDAAER